MLALQAMAELSGMLSHGDSLQLDITLTVDGVDYVFDQITKDNAAVMQSKQVGPAFILLTSYYSVLLHKIHVFILFLVQIYDNETICTFIGHKLQSVFSFI